MPIESIVKLKDIIQRSYNVKSFRLEINAGLDFKAGQFIKVSLGEAQELKRYLSISSSPTEKSYLEFTKKITESNFSKALCNLKSEDEIAIGYPSGKFVLDESCKKIAFLSGGIGITPIRSICKYVADKNIGTDIVLVYSNRSAADIVFKEDFDTLQKDYSLLKVVHVLNESEAGFKCIIGRINSEIVKNEIPDYQQRKFYLCGPPQMVEAMKKILAEALGLSTDLIVTENFTGY